MPQTLVVELNMMDNGLKKMNEMNYGLKKVIWNVIIEADNVLKDELTLSDCIMM